ncbi:MAG: transcriptional regulator [Candidatus Paceibacterota bacterium]
MRSEFGWDIMKRFSGIDQDCFSFQDILREYPNTHKVHLSKILSGMVEKGMLIKLNRNIYHIVPVKMDAETYIPDWHLMAKYLMKAKEYYIGYYSAMQIHGLITQPSLKEIIVTDLQIKPSVKIIRGVEFQFVYHTKARFFGYKSTWINQHEKVAVSELEKTIVDAVSKPDLCGGITEVGKAIYESRTKLDHQKLFDYLTRNGMQVAKKRYLFLSNLLGLEWSSYHESMMNNLGSGYPLLDTTGLNQGRWDSKFGIRINVDINTIKNAIYT